MKIFICNSQSQLNETKIFNDLLPQGHSIKFGYKTLNDNYRESKESKSNMFVYYESIMLFAHVLYDIESFISKIEFIKMTENNNNNELFTDKLITGIHEYIIYFLQKGSIYDN